MATKAKEPDTLRPTVADALAELDRRRDAVIDDVTAISRAVRYIEVAPPSMFDVSLVSELADASDRLACKVGRLQERQGASR